MAFARDAGTGSRTASNGALHTNTIARVLISSAVMCVTIIYWETFYILALIRPAALLYLIVLFIIGGIDKGDIVLLRSIVRQVPLDAVSGSKT